MPKRDLAAVDRFAALPRPDGLPWLADSREGAWAILRERGFPGSKDEDWKYTPARRVLGLAVDTAPSSSGIAAAVPEGSRLVFVDGVYDDARSAPGAFARPLSEGSPGPGRVVADADGFGALNLAFLTDGAVIDVPDGVDGGVLHVVCHGTGGRLQAVRHTVRVGAGASLVLVLHWTGDGADLGTAFSTLEVHGALTLVDLQEVATDAMHVNRIDAWIGAGGVLASTAVSIGASIARTEIRATLGEPGARAQLDGLTLARGRQHHDHHTVIDHAVPDCSSSETYKSILADRAQGVFTGAVIMRRDAQRSDTAQVNHSLLLSDDAVARSRPQLEIHADDVKASHGATVGRLDTDAQFYLQQRGLTANAARALLTWAFAGELVDGVPEVARPVVEARVRTWLEGVT